MRHARRHQHGLTLLKDMFDAVEFASEASSGYNNRGIEIIHLIDRIRIDMHAWFYLVPGCPEPITIYEDSGIRAVDQRWGHLSKSGCQSVLR